MLVYRKSEQWSWLVNKNVGLWTASVKDNISRDLIFWSNNFMYMCNWVRRGVDM